MPRKVDSSAGAGLNGEGIGVVKEVLEMVALAAGLPELFFGLAIAATFCRCASTSEVTGVMTIGSSRPTVHLVVQSSATIKNNTRAPNAALQQQPNK